MLRSWPLDIPPPPVPLPDIWPMPVGPPTALQPIEPGAWRQPDPWFPPDWRDHPDPDPWFGSIEHEYGSDDEYWYGDGKVYYW